MAASPLSGPDARLADTLIAAGDIEPALAVLRGPGDGPPDHAGRAWRTGVVHYLLRGSPRDALESLSRGHLDGTGTTDEALLLSWLAAAYWALGQSDSCTAAATRAIAAAEACGDHRALAAAHVALALRAMLAGDRVANSAHYARALGYAEAAADDLQVIRIRINRASHFMDEDCVPEALADLPVAQELAARLGNRIMLAFALTNEGDALNRLGRLGAAEETYRRSIQLYQQLGSSKVCFGLVGLGDVHRRRGQPALARAAYEEAVPLAEAHGHTQVLVPALAGLAVVVTGTDPPAADALARRALDEAVGPFVTVALLAAGHVRLFGFHDRRAAGHLAERAQHSARTHRDRSGVAQALELQAQSCDDWERATAYLKEAGSIWTDIGAVLDADRVNALLGQLPGNTATIRTLGRFEVVQGGKPVPPSTWQSRKARELLRLLVARRGRPAPREELAELLWADEKNTSPARRAHRLAVALSIVRGVLDSTRQPPAESVVIADGTSICLDVTRIAIDVETFLRQAESGLRLCRFGRLDEGRAALVAAERLYRGDFLEDEPYEDWTLKTRDQARATYLWVGRTLATGAIQAGDTDEAIHYLLRILAVDGYDEQSHLDLIRSYQVAGRHGEARRATERYTDAMRDIGVAARLESDRVNPG